jgi:serine/threonine protein kinase
MKAPDWDLVQKIYHEALNQPPSQRRAFVAKASEHDSVIEREVWGLLDASDSLGDFLDEPIVALPIPSSSDNLLGTPIDERYFIEREVGQGGMSEVYLARDLKVNRRAVVIKILSPKLMQNSYALKKFKQETEALSRIHHQGVVEVLDTGELPDGRPYLVMQYVEGKSLRSQIPNEGMDLERAASILKQIGGALDHVHKNGVFHRDLKPENIMLKRDTDSVVLVDFGIAKVKDSVIAPTTATGDSAGTLLYMSPEQLRGQEITAVSDIYSMGVIAYEMVTGRRPFNPTSPPQLLDLQRKGVRLKPVDLRENLSPKAQTIILRALSFQPRDRYDNASEFGHKLAQALLDGRVAPKKRVSFKVIGVSLLVLISAISLGIYLYTRWVGPPPDPSRSFTYFLMVQKMRDDKPYQAPFKSNGDEKFENGDEFQLTAFGPIPGYLYIMKEGPPELKDTSFTMIYPNRSTNNGDASVGANQPFQSERMPFRGPAGSENFWLVWSNAPVSELELAKVRAFQHPRAGLTGQSLVNVRKYLTDKQIETRATTFHYKATQTAVVRGKGDLLVTLAQFQHR